MAACITTGHSTGSRPGECRSEGPSCEEVKPAWDGVCSRSCRLLCRALVAGRDVNARDRAGWPVVLLASGVGHTDVVKLLVERGAQVDAKRVRTGLTALLVASDVGHIGSWNFSKRPDRDNRMLFGKVGRGHAGDSALSGACATMRAANIGCTWGPVHASRCGCAGASGQALRIRPAQASRCGFIRLVGILRKERACE